MGMGLERGIEEDVKSIPPWGNYKNYWDWQANST
jgi:hypothetical protein